MGQEVLWFWEVVASADHMQTICTLLQTDNHTNTSSLNFYRPVALPDAHKGTCRLLHSGLGWSVSNAGTIVGLSSVYFTN